MYDFNFEVDHLLDFTYMGYGLDFTDMDYGYYQKKKAEVMNV